MTVCYVDQDCVPEELICDHQSFNGMHVVGPLHVLDPVGDSNQGNETDNSSHGTCRDEGVVCDSP